VYKKRIKELDVFSFNETDSFLHLGKFHEEKEELEITPRSYQIGKIIYEQLKDKEKYTKTVLYILLKGCIGFVNATNIVFGDQDFFKYKTI